MQKRMKEITYWCLYSSRLALYAWIHTFNKNGSGLNTEREGGVVCESLAGPALSE